MASSPWLQEVSQGPTAETVASWLRLLLAPEICREPAEFFMERIFIHKYRQQVPEYSLAARSWPSHATKHWDTVGPLVSELFVTPRTFNFVQWMLEYARMTYPKIYGAESTSNDDILDLTDALCDGAVSPLHVAAAIGLEPVCLELISKGTSTGRSGLFGCPLLCALAGPQALAQEFGQLSVDSNVAETSRRQAIISSLLTADAKESKPYSHMNRQSASLITLGFQSSLAAGDRTIIQCIIRGGVDIQYLHQYLRDEDNSTLNPEQLQHLPSVLSGILDLFLISSTLGLDEDDRQNTIGCLADAFNVLTASHTQENLNLTDAEFEEALQDCMIEDNVLCFSRLMHDARFDPNSDSRTTTSSGTLVHSAVCDNLLDIADMAIEVGGRLDTRDSKGRTPLLVSNTTDMLSMLVNRHGASTTSVDNDGRNIWHYVAATADLPLLMWLMAHDKCKFGNLRAKNQAGYTPLDEAFRFGLMSLETNDNRTDLGTQNTALAIQLLLVNGAEYSQTINGIPITHVASIWGLPKIVQTLASHGVDFGVTDSQGRSALHYVTLLASVEHVTVLQRLCASASITDNDGNTPAESIFLSTQVLDGSGRVKDTAYPFVFSSAVYDHLLKPQVLSSRDRQGRTLWERFCTKVVPLTYDTTSSENKSPLQEKWNSAILDALDVLRQRGSYDDYERATKQPAVAALELGVRPHNYQWLFNNYVLQSVIEHSEPNYLTAFFHGPAAQRYLVEALLLDSRPTINFLIAHGVPLHNPHEKLDGMTVLEYVMRKGKYELLDQCIANVDGVALNLRLEEICHILMQPHKLPLANSILDKLIDRGFAPKLSEPGSRDATAMLDLVSRILPTDRAGTILSRMHNKGLNVKSLGYVAADEPNTAKGIPAHRATSQGASAARPAFGSMASTIDRIRAGRLASRQRTPPGRSLSPGTVVRQSRLAESDARMRRHRALGRTRLHMAVVNRNCDILRVLLEAGTRDAVDYEGRTARLIARDEGYDDILRVFEEHDAQQAAPAPEI